MHLTTNTTNLTRAELYSNEIKEIFQDDLFATRYVRWLTDFPDGDLINIPSIGSIEADDYVEGQAIKYNALDTGNFTFQITEYKQSGVYISNKFKQDAFYSAQLESAFVPEMARALAVQMEIDALRVGPAGQTAGNANTIEGVSHRWVGTGAGQTLSAEDFARARLALQKANVPLTNLTAIVDPSVEFVFNTQTGFTNPTFNPNWEGIVREGISTGMQFKMHIFGFDVYVSNYLPNSLTETIHGELITDGTANLFFSSAPGAQPIIGAVRQMPVVETEYNKDEQRTEYVTTSRYGLKLFRDENFVTVLTDATIAAPTYA